jgi:hypothetical protein
MKVVPFLGTGIHSGLPVFIVLVSLLTLPHLLQRFFNCLPCLRAEEDDDEVLSLHATPPFIRFNCVSVLYRSH